ncbi:prealbumin-like fold domain-containing protein [Amycolatopsis sp. NPDC051071]|uniref:prealbumin-like fold domain-containing protein n=1 Tax=Amycolatopsis sp. NPDC051071 TaxID=3154637 RepID=UPI00344477BF
MARLKRACSCRATGGWQTEPWPLESGATATTSVDGTFGFAGLRPGTYTVQEQPQNGGARPPARWAP